MKKIGKITLHEATVLSDKEMKMVVAGSGYVGDGDTCGKISAGTSGANGGQEETCGGICQPRFEQIPGTLNTRPIQRKCVSLSYYIPGVPETIEMRKCDCI